MKALMSQLRREGRFILLSIWDHPPMDLFFAAIVVPSSVFALIALIKFLEPILLIAAVGTGIIYAVVGTFKFIVNLRGCCGK
jgi:hypothetical protein